LHVKDNCYRIHHYMITTAYIEKEVSYDALKPPEQDVIIDDDIGFDLDEAASQNAPLILSKGKEKIVEYLQSLDTASAIKFCSAYKRYTINPIATEQLNDLRKIYFTTCFERTDTKIRRSPENAQIEQALTNVLDRQIAKTILEFAFEPPELEIAFRYICTSDWFLIHDLETQSIERCLETLVEVLHESGYLTIKENVFEVLFSLLMLETQRTNPIASRKSQQLSEQSYVNMLEGYQHSNDARRMYKYVQEEGLSDKKTVSNESRSACCCVVS